MLTASMIICTRDRPEDLARCCDSLAEQTRRPDEFIVVDSGSSPVQDIVQRFAGRVPSSSVQYLRSEPGLTRQRNHGIAAATGDIVHFMDDDVVFDPAYLSAVQETFESDTAESIVGVSPLLEIPHRSPGALGTFVRRVFLLVRANGPGRMQPSGYGTLTWFSPKSAPYPVEVACGCCAYRRRVFDTIRFDEFFDGYALHEDAEFSYSASKLGTILVNPAARIVHLESPSARPDRRRLARMSVVNHWYVFRKHMPQDTGHWICFWWSEIGQNLRRINDFVRSGDLGIFRGAAEGYLYILRHGSTAFAPRNHAS